MLFSRYTCSELGGDPVLSDEHFGFTGIPLYSLGPRPPETHQAARATGASKLSLLATMVLQQLINEFCYQLGMRLKF